MKNKKYYLLLDLGGTNANFILYYTYKNQEIKKYNFKTKRIINFEILLSDLLFKIKSELNIDVDTAYFAVAGKLNKNRTKVKLTNYDLEIDKDSIIKNTKIKKLILFNDMEPIVEAIKIISRKEIINIIKIKKKIETNKNYFSKNINNNYLIINIGTGLGVGIYNKNKVISSELGHKLIDKKKTINPKLIDYLENKLNKKIEYEDILSGRGIENINIYLKNKKTTAKSIFKSKKNRKEFEKVCTLFFDYLIEFIKIMNSEMKINNIYLSGGVIQNNILYSRKTLIEKTKKIKINLSILKNYSITIKGLIEFVKKKNKENLKKRSNFFSENN